MDKIEKAKKLAIVKLIQLASKLICEKEAIYTTGEDFHLPYGSMTYLYHVVDTLDPNLVRGLYVHRGYKWEKIQ